jgi:ribonuclease HI
LKIPKKNYAFIDGSFNPEKKIYGCGGFLIDQFGKKRIIQASGSDPRMVKMRNVAGEILGAKTAINLALLLKMKKLTIFYDYDGIANWPTGKWKCKKPATKKYAEFVLSAISNGLDIMFEHVKGHAGIPGNEEADRLAKEAVGIFKKGA